MALLLRPQVAGTAAAPAEPVTVQRTYGPPQNGIPRLTSDSAAPQPAPPQGDE